MKFKEDRPFAMPEAAERVRIADSSQTSGLGPKSADIVAKVENRTTLKSRESRCLDVSTAAMLARPDTKVRGRICVKRCGASRRRVRTAFSGPEKFCSSARKDFFNSISQFRKSPALLNRACSSSFK
jgi:hypothetical protein